MIQLREIKNSLTKQRNDNIVVATDNLGMSSNHDYQEVDSPYSEIYEQPDVGLSDKINEFGYKTPEPFYLEMKDPFVCSRPLETDV